MDPTRVTRRSAAIALAISRTGGLLAVLVMVLGGAKPAGAAASPYCTALAPSGGSELLIARYAAVAAPLPNGQVLIAGGKSGSTFLASAELFNAASDTFTALPASGNTELQTARAGAVAAPLPNGQVLIAGGYNGSSYPQSADGYLASAELFNPASDTFAALPASGATELHIARDGAVAAPLPNGRVLIAGGYSYNAYDPDYSSVLRSAELFNPANDTFKALAASGATELRTARESAVAAPLPNGQVLIAGGDSAQNSALRSAELFNPANDTFKALAASGSTELQTARAGAVAARLPNGQVLIAGGYNRSGYLQRAELCSSVSRKNASATAWSDNHS